MIAIIGPAGLPMAVHAGDYQTDLFLQNPLSNPYGIDRVTYLFSTASTTGVINQNDLTDWTMESYSGATLIYTDVIKSGGVYQPVGGAARGSATTLWDFDLDALTLSQMSNFPIGGLSGMTGTQYLVTDNVSLPVDSQVGIFKYVNENQESLTIDLLASQRTTVFPPVAVQSTTWDGVESLFR